MWYPTSRRAGGGREGAGPAEGAPAEGPVADEVPQIIRKDEMTDDLTLVPVPKSQGAGLRADHADEPAVASEASGASRVLSESKDKARRRTKRVEGCRPVRITEEAG